MVRVAQGKEACHPAFVNGCFQCRTASHFVIANPPLLIFALQHHVHHQGVLPLFFLAQRCIVATIFAFIRFSVHLYLVHRISRQIAQGYFGVAVEKVASVNQQTFHKLTVHRDASVVVKVYSRKGTHQVVEHRPFVHSESGGVIFYRIALHHHQYARSIHLCLAEVLVQLGPKVNIFSRIPHLFIGVLRIPLWNLPLPELGRISLTLHPDYHMIATGNCTLMANILIINEPSLQRISHQRHTVLLHNRHTCLRQCFLRKTIQHFYIPHKHRRLLS